MAVKVLIVRRGTPRCFEELKPLVQRLRALALAQPGYVSGETFLNIDVPGEYLVISTWASLEKWTDWLNNPERVAVQSDIDALLGEPTLYQVYQHV